jgi:hypothetical protein
MQNIRKLSMAISLISLSFVVGVVTVRASPETPQLGSAVLTPLLSNILNNVNKLGDDSFSTIDLSGMSPPPTQHYGPYASTSPDSGSCGNDWATDSFNRFFSIFSQDGAIVVVQQFKNFSFVTPAVDSPQPNPSPGACENGPYDGGVVANGVTGSAVGYFIIQTIPGTTVTSTNPNCDAVTSSNADCTTATFINTHLSCTYTVTCTVTTFYDHYTAPRTSTMPNSGLIAGSWKDASSDRGGEIGDIESSVITI